MFAICRVGKAQHNILEPHLTPKKHKNQSDVLSADVSKSVQFESQYILNHFPESAFASCIQFEQRISDAECNTISFNIYHNKRLFDELIRSLKRRSPPCSVREFHFDSQFAFWLAEMFEQLVLFPQHTKIFRKYVEENCIGWAMLEKPFCDQFLTWYKFESNFTGKYKYLLCARTSNKNVSLKSATRRSLKFRVQYEKDRNQVKRALQRLWFIGGNVSVYNNDSRSFERHTCELNLSHYILLGIAYSEEKTFLIVRDKKSQKTDFFDLRSMEEHTDPKEL